MSRSQNAWSWIVFAFSVGGYLPLVVGAVHHPPELNVASYGLWLILCVMFIGSSLSLGFVGWRLPFGLFIGNAGMLVLACFLKGPTFNLGPAEQIALFGTIITVAVWVVHGHLKRGRNPRILLWGAVIIDVLSCYPQFKQYLYDVHQPMSSLGITGWTMWIVGVAVNLIFVDEFFRKLKMSLRKYRTIYGEEKSIGRLCEASVFSLEQLIIMPATLAIMW